MKTYYYYNHTVILCTLILVCNALEPVTSPLSQSVDHGTKNVDQDSHVLNSPRGYMSRFIAESVKVLAPISTAVENDLCRKHSLWFQDGVLNNKMWALKMFDASSKLPSGLLEGNVVQLGNYDECVSVEDVETEYGRFSGQHCTVATGETTITNTISMIDKEFMRLNMQIFTEEDIKEGFDSLLPKMSMLWSVCVPSSCGHADVQQHLRSALRTWLGNASITVHDGACSTRANRIPLRTVDWCFIVFLLGVGVLVFLSTIYDLTTRQSSSRTELLLAFSLPFHWRRLLRVDPPSLNALPVINGVKAISMVMVIFVHFSSLLFSYPADNYLTLYKRVTTEGGLLDALGFNGGLAVDSFLVVSGLLMCYNFLKDRENGVKFSLTHYYLHRYIRIAPLYVVLQILSATLYTTDLVFDGPFWRYNARGIRNACGDTLVHSLLFVTNFLTKREMCMGGPDWYLAVDMQLFLISPLVLFPLWRRPKFGKCLVFFFTLLGIVISVGVSYVYKLRLSYASDSGEVARRLYFPTYTRFTPWVIGIALGYALHATKRVSPRLARSTVTCAWILAVTLMATSLFLVNHFLKPGYQYERLTSTLYVGLMHQAWALGLAWVVFAFSRGYGATWVLNIFSNRTFQVLNRLSYSVYLIHLHVVLGFFLNVKTPVHFTDVALGIQFIYQVVTCVACGCICHLLIEAPPIYIERIMFGNAKNGQKEQKTK